MANDVANVVAEEAMTAVVKETAFPIEFIGGVAVGLFVPMVVNGLTKLVNKVKTKIADKKAKKAEQQTENA